jgi:hypothetical protein
MGRTECRVVEEMQPMSRPSSRLAGIVALLCFTAATPTAGAQPSLPTDQRGYVDSTARCAAPDKAVAFGHTASSRVAICVDPDGQYQYRGVRVRDGAKLIVPAERSDGSGFVAENDGVTYLVTASSLVVSVGERVIRDEPMVDFEEPGAPKATPSPTKTPPLPPPLPAEVGGSGS